MVNRKYADALLNAVGSHGLSIAALARMSGLHMNTLYNWANARSMPDERHWDMVRRNVPLPSWASLRVCGHSEPRRDAQRNSVGNQSTTQTETL